MENLSTPIADKKLLTLNGNKTKYYNEDEQISFRNNLTGSASPFLVNISPINHNSNTSKEVTSDHESNEPGTIVHNDPLQDDETSFDCNNSTNSGELVIDDNSNISKEVTSDHESNEPGTNVHNVPLQDDETSFDCNNSTNSGELVIDDNSNISKEVTSDHESNEPDTNVYNDSVQDVGTSIDCNNSINSEELDGDINKTREVMSEHENNEQDTLAYNDALHDDQASFEYGNMNKSRNMMLDHESAEPDSVSNDSTSSEELDLASTSNCSAEGDYSFSQEVDIESVKDTMMEMSQAVHKYINKIKQLDIFVEWELPNTLIALKGLRKSEGGLKGPLEPEEVSFIKKRLRQFCEEYNINYGAIRACLADKVSKFQFPNELRLKFIQYLCKDYVNDRNPMSIFKAISKLGIRKGRFSEEEENFLIEMYHNYRGSYLHSVCGLMLNRHRNQIFKKFERLKKKGFLGLRPSSNNVKTDRLKLRNLILNDMLNRRNYNVERLKYRLNTRSWSSIGREHNVSPALAKAIYICEIFPQIYAVHPVKFDRFFTKMLYRIKRSDWATWEEVKWKELSSLLYDVGPVFVYVMLRKIIMHCVPKEKWISFRECAEYLHQHVLPYFENGPKKKMLNKILVKRDEKGD
ncbi:unnamed protein product [Nezara viridula]|uniref:Uncharacterized protein n=1 Tax=Nezara viridula TaxID=85310 RepID=A0A9P0H459_NEZVI|nr:unnamed protein product [Nezara viridula]